MSEAKATVGIMESAHIPATVDTCPVCASAHVRASEPLWFAIELDRADDLREPAVEFRCNDCGSDWG